MRAATWAHASGAGERFARLAFRRAFLEGGDLGDVDVLAGVARRAELDPDAMRNAIAAPPVKAALRRETDGAWALGVRGVPTLVAGDAVFFGDDHLEAAAAHLAAGTIAASPPRPR